MSGDDIGSINTTAAISSQNGHLDWEDMFSKSLTSSDITKPQKCNTTTNKKKRSSRLVLPKQQAEKYFGLLRRDGAPNGKELNFEDELGQKWTFWYSLWPSSQSCVLTKGWGRYVKGKGLRARDTVFFKRHRRDSNRFLIERNHSVSQATSSADGQRLQVPTGVFNKTEQKSQVQPDPPTRIGTLVGHNLDCKDSGNITTVGSTVDQVAEVVPSGNVPVDDRTIPKETIAVSVPNSDDKTKDNCGWDFSNLMPSSAGYNNAAEVETPPVLARLKNMHSVWRILHGNAHHQEVLTESNIDALNAPSIKQQPLEFSSFNYEIISSLMRSPVSFGYEVMINSNNNSFSKGADPVADSSAQPTAVPMFPVHVPTELSLTPSIISDNGVLTNSNDKFSSKGAVPAAASPAKHQRNLDPNLSLAIPSVSSATEDNFNSSNNNSVANALLVTDHSMESEQKQRHHELVKSIDSLISPVDDKLSSYCEMYKRRDPGFAPQLESHHQLFQNFAIQSVGIIMKIFCETKVDQSLTTEHRSLIESYWQPLRRSELSLPELEKLVAASQKPTPFEEAYRDVYNANQSLKKIEKERESAQRLLIDLESKQKEAGIAIHNGTERLKRFKSSSWIEALNN